MKERIRLFYHRLRMEWYRSGMIAKLDKEGASHFMLLVWDSRYARCNRKYNESKNLLIAAGVYITAQSMIAKKVPDSKV